MEENGRGINSSNNDGQGQLGQEKRASKLEDVRDQKDRNTGRLCEGTKGLTPVSTGKGKRLSILQQRNDCSRMERRRPAASDVAGGHDLGRRAHGYGRAAGFSGVDALSSCIGGGRVRHRDPILCPDAPYLGEGQSSPVARGTVEQSNQQR